MYNAGARGPLHSTSANIGPPANRGPLQLRPAAVTASRSCVQLQLRPVAVASSRIRTPVRNGRSERAFGTSVLGPLSPVTIGQQMVKFTIIRGLDRILFLNLARGQYGPGRPAPAGYPRIILLAAQRWPISAGAPWGAGSTDMGQVSGGQCRPPEHGAGSGPNIGGATRGPTRPRPATRGQPWRRTSLLPAPGQPEQAALSWALFLKVFLPERPRSFGAIRIKRPHVHT